MSPIAQTSSSATRSTIAVILGGGRGTRLYPLTQYRAKPAVPLAGKYRLIDIPISNCLNSGLDRMYILTQFMSSSLNSHITATYQLDPFSRGFVRLEVANQSQENENWYQGTADAVHRNIKTITQWQSDYILILPGDTIFRMDLSKLIDFHAENGADVTVAVHSTAENKASAFGIINLDEENRVTHMAEKPSLDKLPPLMTPPKMRKLWSMSDTRPYLASMGIYVFNRQVLIDFLDNPTMIDFGHDILPAAVNSHKVCGYVFNDFWEDIGTIRSFYEVNLELARVNTPFHFYSLDSPIYTHLRFLPASYIGQVDARESRIAEGCRIGQAVLDNCVVGIRSVIGRGVSLKRTVMMGADYYDDSARREHFEPLPPDAPPQGIGDGCQIEGALIDKNARIGEGCIIHSADGKPDYTDPQERYYIRDGVVIIPKHGILPPGTEI